MGGRGTESTSCLARRRPQSHRRRARRFGSAPRGASGAASRTNGGGRERTGILEILGVACTPESATNEGANEYRENIINGSECAYGVNDLVDTLTGAQVAGTCQGFNALLGTNTDSFGSVFGGLDGDVYESVNAASPRYGLLPVVYVPPGSTGSSTPVTIKTFITVYIVGTTCLGNNTATVRVIPAKSHVYVQGIPFVGPGPGPSNFPLYMVILTD